MLKDCFFQVRPTQKNRHMHKTILFCCITVFFENIENAPYVCTLHLSVCMFSIPNICSNDCKDISWFIFCPTQYSTSAIVFSLVILLFSFIFLTRSNCFLFKQYFWKLFWNPIMMVQLFQWFLSKVTNCTLALKTSLAKNLSSKSEFHVTVQCN